MDDIQLIIDLISELGQEGKQAFIYWLLVAKLPGYLLGLAWTVGGLFLLWKALLLLKYAMLEEENDRALKTIIRELGMHLPLYHPELERILTLIRKGKEAERD